MNKDETMIMIKEILNSELELNISDVNSENTLLELGIDSIILMTLIVYLEDRLSIEIDITEDLIGDYSNIKADTVISSIIRKCVCN